MLFLWRGNGSEVATRDYPLSLLPCSSLVATNDHLLRELEETKLRHEQEVMQMSLNYEHLRRTVDFIQSTS